MIYVYPDYYKEFKCIQSRCRHNCCIGWEIDIDPDTLVTYQHTEGDLGGKLRDNIKEEEGICHFVLTENERCPFLNSCNLCDIIIDLGEDKLCDICKEHPRFHNSLPHRVESGLGLCCEEAARIILTKKEPVSLIYSDTDSCKDEIIGLRDRVITLLQNRSKDISCRLADALKLCGSDTKEINISRWTDFLLRLERLDPHWTRMLTLLKDKCSPDCKEFDIYMKDRHEEYEQFCVYLVYRHMATAPDLEEATLRMEFVNLCYTIVKSIGTALYNKNGKFTTEEQIDLCRMFSSELEYSDENINLILDELFFQKSPDGCC